MADSIGNLHAIISANNSNFNSAFKSSTQVATQFQTTIGKTATHVANLTRGFNVLSGSGLGTFNTAIFKAIDSFALLSSMMLHATDNLTDLQAQAKEGIATPAIGGSALDAAQSARLAELRRQSAERLKQPGRGDELTKLHESATLIAKRADIATRSLNQTTKSVGLLSSAANAAGGAISRFTGGLVNMFGKGPAVVGSIFALVEAIQNFHLWATKGAEAFDAEGRAALKVWHFITRNNTAQQLDKGWQEHLANVAAVEQKHQEINKQLEIQRKIAADIDRRAKEADDRVFDVAKELNEQRFAAAGESPRDKALRQARDESTTLDEFNRKASIIKTQFDAIEENTALKSFADGVKEAQEELQNFGKTQNEILIEAMEKSLAKFVELRDVARQLQLKQFIADVRAADKAVKDLNDQKKRQDDALQKVLDGFQELTSIREKTADVGKDFSPGFFQRGSVEEFQQTRRVQLDQKTLEQLQKESNAINRQIQDYAKLTGMSTKALAEYLINNDVRLH